MLYAGRPAQHLPPDVSSRKLDRCQYLIVMNLIGVHRAKYPLGVINHGRLGLVDIEYDSFNRQQAYLFKIRY